MLHHRIRSASNNNTDPYFNYTTLLLSGEGSNGGQNNTFVDSSSNAFSVTRYGNTTQGTFSPFSAPDGYWSVSFDGSGDYLSVSNPSNLSFGTGAFTVEFWMNWSGTTASPYMGVLGPHNGGSQLYGVFLDSSGNIGIYLGGSTFGNTLAAAVKPTPGKWMHIASCRDSSGVHRFYVDGVLKDTTTDTTNLSASGGFNIGVDRSSGRPPFSGQISNLRVLSSTALYTGSSITPSTSPLTAVSGTSLLTCQSNRFLDKSTNAATITRNGDAKVTNFAPFPTNSEYSTGVNGGSGYFDGAGDYLAIGSNSAFDFGTGNFTVEFWVNTYSTSAGTQFFNLNSNLDFIIGTNGSNYLEYFASGATRIGTSIILTNLSWNHIACCRSSGTTRLFLNGIQVGSWSDGGYYYSPNGIIIGKRSDSSLSVNGYISSLRVLKGTAQYNANFTPSTTPFTAIDNTSLLLNFTNASVIDGTGRHNIQTVNTARISTTDKKYGSGSIRFDGSGDYLTGDHLKIQSNSAFNLSKADFTIEGWIKCGTQSSYDCLVARSGSLTERIYLGFDASGTKLEWWQDSINGSGPIASSTTVVSDNNWHHFAFVRYLDSLKIFVDGIAGSVSTTSSFTFSASAEPMVIGTDTNPNRLFTGNIDDFRMTVGVARYTANFIPPAKPFPTR